MRSDRQPHMWSNRLALRCVVLILATLFTAVNARAQAAGPPAVQSLTLGQALQYALDHYPSVRTALEQVTVSTANADGARTASLPRFDALWQTNRATANNVF